MTQPNILLIMTDTHRCDALRCMGADFAISPNLDRMAAEGVLYENAHTTSPVCMPARCSLMTGVQPSVHGCIENGFKRHVHLPMLPDLLQDQGYHNIMVGKTHFGPVPDSFHVQRLSGSKKVDADDAYGEFIKAKGYPRVTRHLVDNPVPEDLFMDAFHATTTIEEIREARNEPKRPFFAFCSLVSPHGPIDPPGRWASLYDDVDLPPLNYHEGEIASHPPAQRALLGYPDQPDQMGDELTFHRRRYYGLASYCDYQVGRMLSFLDESGLRENTLVIFTSDHGQQYMDHGFNNKHNWYDETWRVPMIMSQPGTLSEGERAGFATTTDVATTILGAAGTSCHTMQGYDLYSPLVKGEPSPRVCASGSIYKSVALATARWKLTFYFEDGSGQLFDRRNDPGEQTDLYCDTQHQEVRDRLLQALFAWYGDSMDNRSLLDRASSGGPIATRTLDRFKNCTGLEAEDRLNQACREVDELHR